MMTMIKADSFALSIENHLLNSTIRLKDVSDSPRLDAEILLAFVLNCDRVDLVRKRNEFITKDDFNKFEDFIERRRKKEPVAYITGIKDFWNLSFKVTPAVLIPRPDTETLVEEALKIIFVFNTETTTRQKFKILDLGTGSGAIIIAICSELRAKNIPFQGVAVDLSDEALLIAKENAQRYGVASDITFKKSDWFSELTSEDGLFDLIVSNPPYIGVGDLKVSPDVKYEPDRALYSGVDGLDSYRVILPHLPNFLSLRGSFLGEIGFDHGSKVIKLSSNALPSDQFTAAKIIKDLAGNDRVLIVSKR